MIREIDSRTSPATGVTVELVMDTDRPDWFMVFVKNADGVNVTTIGASSRAEALDAFLHPFARQSTPDVFTANASVTDQD